MATTDVLVAVDVEGALASGDLGGNLYMMDTNKYLGSLNEGSNELTTTLHAGDQITWSVVPIDPATSVSIAQFGGNATGVNITPAKQPNGSWSATFAPAPPPTPGASYQYTMSLAFEGGRTLTFDPFLTVAT